MRYMNQFSLRKSGNRKLIENQLIEKAWVGTQATKPGFSSDAKDVFGRSVKIRFQKDGSCLLEVRDESLPADWEIRGEGLSISGERIEAEGKFHIDARKRTLEYFTLHPVEEYSITFFSERALSWEAARQERSDVNFKRTIDRKRRQVSTWQSRQAVDLSTCAPDFADLLKARKFERFQPLLIEPGTEEAFIKKYFHPVLSLGLQHTSWSWHYQSQDDRMLDGYERYEYNPGLGPEERMERDGETVIVPFGEVYSYIAPRILVERHPLIDKLQEMLERSPRYSADPHGLKMEISRDADGRFPVKLAGAWEYRDQIVIHMLYGDGNSVEDHAWFFLEKSSVQDIYRYVGGSAFER